MKRWFTENTGYVLQLATPFYEELTIRENLLLAVNMQLPKTANWNQKLERVEQVIREVLYLFSCNALEIPLCQSMERLGYFKWLM